MLQVYVGVGVGVRMGWVCVGVCMCGCVHVCMRVCARERACMKFPYTETGAPTNKDVCLLKKFFFFGLPSADSPAERRAAQDVVCQ